MILEVLSIARQVATTSIPERAEPIACPRRANYWPVIWRLRVRK
jgi:hypothetical protein